jgi:hypothetical protein
VTHQIVQMQALHDDDNCAGPLVIEAGIERVVEPIVGGLTLRLGQSLVRLHRVIDDHDVAAAAGQHAADRGGHPTAALGGQMPV